MVEVAVGSRHHTDRDQCTHEYDAGDDADYGELVDRLAGGPGRTRDLDDDLVEHQRDRQRFDVLVGVGIDPGDQLFDHVGQPRAARIVRRCATGRPGLGYEAPPDDMPINSEPIHIRVCVPDVTQALRFYERAFDGTRDASSSIVLPDGRFIVEVLPDDAQSREYETAEDKGRVPRLELVVNDIEDALQRFLDAGGVLRVRTGTSRHYAQVVDPYGHMWAFDGPKPRG